MADSLKGAAAPILPAALAVSFSPVSRATPRTQANTITSAPAVRYAKRGKFRKAEPLPDHLQATRDLLDSLPVHGLPATTVRELLHAMAHALTSLEYKARNQPDRAIGDRAVMFDWYVTYAAQAKALLYAARADGEGLTAGPDFPPDMPVPQPIVVTEGDCRKRFLDLMNDGELTAAIRPDCVSYPSFTNEARNRMADDAFRLYADLIESGAVRVGGAV